MYEMDNSLFRSKPKSRCHHPYYLVLWFPPWTRSPPEDENFRWSQVVLCLGVLEVLERSSGFPVLVEAFPSSSCPIRPDAFYEVLGAVGLFFHRYEGLSLDFSFPYSKGRVNHPAFLSLKLFQCPVSHSKCIFSARRGPECLQTH